MTFKVDRYNDLSAGTEQMAAGEWVALSENKRPSVEVVIEKIGAIIRSDTSKRKREVEAPVSGHVRVNRTRIPFTSVAIFSHQHKRSNLRDRLLVSLKFSVSSASLGLTSHPDPELHLDVRGVGFLEK
jgi:hypothetical protein